MKRWILFVGFLFSISGWAQIAPQAEPQLELLIHPISSTSEWGHVSVRTVSAGKDRTYDFGRYGFMWHFNGKGDPVLRVWDSFDAYMKYGTQGDRSMYRFIFSATAEQVHSVQSYFEDHLRQGKRYTGKEGRWRKGKEVRNYEAPGSKNYIAPGLGEFHATQNNCTTVSLAGLAKAYPSLNFQKQYDYIQGKNADKGISYYNLAGPVEAIVMSQLKSEIRKNQRSGLMFWPEDLLAFTLNKKHDLPEIQKIELWKTYSKDSQPEVLK
ncbi:MAG: hypothetical protein ACK5RO_05275 [Pseudobdellovibrionaceae bacterium]|jgi:hypothetical protein